jgi:hypothetical protein
MNQGSGQCQRGWPAKNPRTVCGAQPEASTTCATVVPSGRRSNAGTPACLVRGSHEGRQDGVVRLRGFPGADYRGDGGAQGERILRRGGGLRAHGRLRVCSGTEHDGSGQMQMRPLSVMRSAIQPPASPWRQPRPAGAEQLVEARRTIRSGSPASQADCRLVCPRRQRRACRTQSNRPLLSPRPDSAAHVSASWTPSSLPSIRVN